MNESPKNIGKYEIVGTLGSGAMGTVYKGRDPVLNRFVAIKTISTNLLSESELKQRFLREARAAAQLNHPNIVTVYEFAEDSNGVFLAMELLEGRSLQDLIDKNELGAIDQRIDILEQICEGLGFAHEAGIVHRDLKPGNIHVGKDGRAKLLDFGLVRLPSSDITKTGHVMGTPNYMSPEQVNGDPVDVRSDVFSVGVICYEMLTGQKPFRADTVPATMFRIVQGKREPLRNFSHVPEPLVRVVEKTLSLDRDARPPNAMALLIDLQEVRDESIAMAQELDFTAQATVIAPSGGTPSRPRASRSGRSRAGSASVRPASGPRVPSIPRTPAAMDPTTRRKPAPPASSGSKLPVIGAAVLVVGLLAGGFFWLRSSGSGGRVDELNQELITSQQELLQRSFDQKDFEAAIAQADRLLELDPENALATDLKQQSTESLAQVEAIANEARQAVEAQDMETAADALARVLELAPAHPLGTELGRTLDEHFGARAQSALDQMNAARARANSASSQPSFNQAESLRSRGDSEFNNGEYTSAAQHYLEASNLYERARQDAARQTAQAARATSTAPAPPPKREPAVEPTPAEDPRLRRAFDEAKRAFGDASQQAQSEGVASSALARARSAQTRAESQASSGSLEQATRVYEDSTRELRAAVREHRAAEAARVAAAQQTTSTPPTTVVSDEELIRQLLAQYKQAIESENIQLYRAVKPNVTGDEQRRLEASFEAMDSHTVDLTVQTLRVEGDSATAEIARQDVIDAGGQRQTNSSQQTFTFSKQSGKWVIVRTGR